MAPLSDYPVQLGKVQAPPLRDDTLARDRLLDWLSVKVHSRVVLLVAEAGYGKTTLLADFSRRTRVRVLWFRLDRGDRDWVGFIGHLVAAVRVHHPAFGGSTSALLRETATSAPSIDTVLDAFLRELSALPDDPTAFVFDDVHLVDDASDVRDVLRELLARAPERMSFVFATRREPPVRLARLRALGEVAELGTDDLRFDAAETERLFREIYEMPLEPAVLAELGRRTEGWAASLQLVRAALHDRNAAQVRTFIASLSGAEGHLYEYLAEEVIGDLPSELQTFLMRTSLLDVVDLTLGPIAADLRVEETGFRIEEAERHGLLGRGGSSSRAPARAHPLVRDFLQARLRRSIGEEGVREIHARVAMAAESVDWLKAARHYLSAGRDEDARRVLASSIENVLAGGAYAAAQEIAISLGSEGLQGAAGLVLRSRLAQQRAAGEEALDLAEKAWVLEPESTPVILNLVTARVIAGDVAGALEAGRILELQGRPGLSDIGRAFQRTIETSVNGSVGVAERELVEIADSLRGSFASHYRGVALLNRAHLLSAKGDFDEAVDAASEAATELEDSSAGLELVSAKLARATALAFRGEMAEARSELRSVLEDTTPGQMIELAVDGSMLEGMVGESFHGWAILNAVGLLPSPASDLGEQARLGRALLHLQDGDLMRARADVDELSHGQLRTSVAFEARRLLIEGLLDALEGKGVSTSALAGAQLAASQGASFWAQYGQVLIALSDRSKDPSDLVRQVSLVSPVTISCLTEMVVFRLADLDSAAFNEVALEAQRRPWRWRACIRRQLDTPPDSQDPIRLADLLERIGQLEDIHRLRRVAKQSGRGQKFGFALARRLADRVFIDDLGRVRINIGSRQIEGADIRRKVLALLCLLISKPGFASTREEVLDSLWPEHDPVSALNSLNQTVYFLRRVFEPEFNEQTSPEYVGQDGETIWLDSELVDSRSQRCMRIIRSISGDGSPESVVALAAEYRGRFALDFAYEDWSAAYRDGLHAAYLRVVERSIRLDLDGGHFERGTFIAERAAEVDPDADEIQAALVRLYSHGGAHAAAAEQYSHYAQTMHEIGVEPAALSDV
jgi:LuxR family transcriptional regulator, maltose regulon positive regulatory protein